MDACFTATYFYVGKDPTFALFCAIPFGRNARQQNAWFYDGDGLKLMNEFVQKFNLYALVAANTGCQMDGWFRKEIKEVADFNGLKFRIGGFAGKTIQRLGGVPQQIALVISIRLWSEAPSMPQSGSASMTTKGSDSIRSPNITIRVRPPTIY